MLKVYYKEKNYFNLIMDNNIINKLNNLQIDNTESRYNILKKQNIEDEKKAIAFRNSDEYKNWYDTEYKKSMEEMAASSSCWFAISSLSCFFNKCAPRTR